MLLCIGYEVIILEKSNQIDTLLGDLNCQSMKSEASQTCDKVHEWFYYQKAFIWGSGITSLLIIIMIGAGYCLDGQLAKPGKD